MDEFENRIIRGIYTSQYVASWMNTKGHKPKWKYFVSKEDPNRRIPKRVFQEWLRSLIINGEHLTEEEVRFICNYAGNGKFELEQHAERFLENMRPGTPVVES